MNETKVGDEIVEVSDSTGQYERRIATIKKINLRMNMLILDNDARYYLSNGHGRIGNEHRHLARVTAADKEEVIIDSHMEAIPYDTFPVEDTY